MPKIVMSTNTSSGSSAYWINPLKGTKNYATWKIKITDILNDMGLSEHIEDWPPVALISLWKLVSQSQSADWDSNDWRALIAIWLRVGDTILVYVTNAKEASDAWRILCDVFEPQGSMGLVLTHRKISRAECAKGMLMEEHIHVMCGYQEELALLGNPLPDTDFSITLLMSLLESWNTFISAANMNLLKNWHLLITRILKEDWRIRAKDGKDLALAAKGKGGKPSTKGKPGSNITCYNCQNQGHIACNCQSKKKTSGNQDSGSNNQANQAKEAFIFAALDDTNTAFATDHHNTWVTDSGVTSHVCRDRNLFTNYTTTQGGTIQGTGTINIHRCGTVKLKLNVSGTIKPITLQNVLHAPIMLNNLVSLLHATNSGLKVIMERNDLKIHSPKGEILGIGKKVRRLYKMELSSRDEAYISKVGHTWDEWHQIFGHMYVGSVQLLKWKNMMERTDVDEWITSSWQCMPCIWSKTTPHPIPEIDKWISARSRWTNSIQCLGTNQGPINSQKLLLHFIYRCKIPQITNLFHEK